MNSERCALCGFILLPLLSNEGEEECLINLLFIVVRSSSSDTKHHMYYIQMKCVLFNLLFDTFFFVTAAS